MLEHFRYVSRFNVAYADVDMMRHANNLAYLRWAEEQRAAYLSEVLGEVPYGERGIILLKIDCTYEQQLRYREPVACATRISRIGRKSFVYSFEIWSETHRHRAAFGETVMVAYDYTARRSIEVPSAWRELVAAYEPVAPTD
jgi:acyl-CoA thioester hydrolase